MSLNFQFSCVTWIQTTRSIQQMNKNMSIHIYVQVKNANGFQSFGKFAWKTVVCIQCGYSVVDVLVYPVSNSDFSGVKTQIFGLNDACNICMLWANLNHEWNFIWLPEMAEHVSCVCVDVLEQHYINIALINEFILMFCSLCITPGSLTLKQPWKKESKGDIISGSDTAADVEKTRKKVWQSLSLENYWSLFPPPIKKVIVTIQLCRIVRHISRIAYFNMQDINV